MSDIVPYRETHLEKISGTALIPIELLKQNLPRFFLASPIYVGKHNQVGFVIVDRTPNERPYWIGSDIMRFRPEKVEQEIEQHKKFGAGIPEEKRFFYDTRGSMAALRYFAVSDTLMGILERDEFLGPAMVRKICEEAAVPREFEELPVIPPDSRESISEYCAEWYLEQNGLGIVIGAALGPLKQRTGTEYTSQSYVTYFPTIAYSLIVPTLEESVQEVVARFDQFGDRFGLLETYKDELQGNRLLLGQGN